MPDIERKSTVERIIKTRAPKSSCGWRTISIPDDLYLKLERLSDEKGESIALIVRKLINGFLKV